MSPRHRLFGDDVKCVKDELYRLVNEDKEILVLAHSSGGAVVTEAVVESFSLRARRAQKKSGGVAGIIYMASFMMSKGPSIAGGAGGLDPRIYYDKDTLLSTMLNDPQIFYNDLPAREAQYWLRQGAMQSVLVLCAEITHEAWRYHPVGTIYTMKDNSVPVEYQRKYVDVVKGQTRADGEKVNVVEREIETSHSPFLSRPDLLFETVEGMLAEFEKSD